MATMATRILIVEDDPDIAELVARYLEKADYRRGSTPARKRSM